MFTGLELMACQNLAISAEVMQHVVQVESSANPYAIGVVGAHLVRQPQSLDEALATVRMLDAGHHNYSLGLAQVNRANLRKYGLDSYRQAFAPCANAAAGARILADCYTSSGRDWGKAFSCYYSGDPVSGYRDGYVQKIYGSMRHDASGRTTAGTLRVSARPERAGSTQASGQRRELPDPGSRAWRLALRSTTGGPMMTASSASMQAPVSATAQDPATAPDPQSQAAATDPIGNQAANGVFVPRVRGPYDPASANPTQEPTPSAPAAAGTDHADLRKEHRDAAFVF